MQKSHQIPLKSLAEFLVGLNLGIVGRTLHNLIPGDE